jgi:ribosomal protein S6
MCFKTKHRKNVVSKKCEKLQGIAEENGGKQNRENIWGNLGNNLVF